MYGQWLAALASGSGYHQTMRLATLPGGLIPRRRLSLALGRQSTTSPRGYLLNAFLHFGHLDVHNLNRIERTQWPNRGVIHIEKWNYESITTKVTSVLLLPKSTNQFEISCLTATNCQHGETHISHKIGTTLVPPCGHWLATRRQANLT